MSAKSNAQALRTISGWPESRPVNYGVERSVVLTELGKALESYASALPHLIADAYNRKARLEKWCPVPLEQALLGPDKAYFLQFERARVVEILEGSHGACSMREAASAAEVVLTILLRPFGVSVICDFLEQESKGELRIISI